MGNRAMGYIFQKVLVSIIQATSYIDVGYSGLINDQPMMVPNLEIRNLSPPCKVFIAYFVHLLYFVYCCNVFPTSQEWRFIVYTIQFSHYKLQME